MSSLIGRFAEAKTGEHRYATWTRGEIVAVCEPLGTLWIMTEDGEIHLSRWTDLTIALESR